jgi:preprotein translocase subunit SecE
MRGCAGGNDNSAKAGERWTMGKLFQFFQDVRAEGAKVTWPTRKETAITTAMVFVMVVVASIFFLLADMVIRWGVSLILGIGR